VSAGGKVASGSSVVSNHAAAAASGQAAGGGGLAAAEPAAGVREEGPDGLSAAAAGGQAAGAGVRSPGDGFVGAGALHPRVIAPVAWLPAGTFGHSLGAWAETRGEEELIRLRLDMAEDLWMDRATLLEPYP